MSVLQKLGMDMKGIKNKYTNLSKPVKASLWYTVCNILNKGIALFSTPIFTRILTEEQYGTFSIFQSWYGILIIFTSLNIFLGGYQKGLLLYKNDVEGFTASQLSLTSTITIVFFFIYLFNVSFWTSVFELPPHLMAAMFIELLTIPAMEFWSVRERFDFRYKKYVIMSMMMNVLSIGCGILAVLNTEYKVEARVFCDVFAKTMFSGALFILIMAKGKTFFNWKYWRYALAFNLPLIPHYLSNYVLSQSDRLMIGRMVGNSQAAFYSVAYTISTMMLLITSAINNSLTPYIYKMLDSGEHGNVKKVTKMLIMLVAGLCIVTMAFAPEVIMIFAGQRYMDAVYVIPPIAASVFFIFLYSLYSNIEYFYEKTGCIAIATCVSAVLNLILNYIFINLFGYYAAGYTTLVCYICLAFMHYFFYRKVLKQVNGKVIELYDEKLIIVFVIITLAVMLVMVAIYKMIIVRYMMIGVVLLVAFFYRGKIRNLIREFNTK